jgi:hypothetical protein
MNSNDLLDYFGEVLMSKVRDETIWNHEAVVNGKMRAPSLIKKYKKLDSFSEEQKKILREFILRTVDLTIHNFLFMIEESEDLSLILNNADLAELSDGLCGELYSDDGWIAKYSENEEFSD